MLKRFDPREWEHSDSNREPRNYEFPALTVELCSLNDRASIVEWSEIDGEYNQKYQVLHALSCSR